MEIFKTSLLVAFAIATIIIEIVSAAETNTVESQKSANNSSSAISQQSSTPTFHSFLSPGDLYLKSGFGQALVVGGAVVVSVLVLGVLTIILTPVFGFKICQLMGNCESPFAYSASGVGNSPQPNPAYNEVYGAYVPTTAYANYQKRSLEYVGPILKALASAYEKYGQHPRKNE